MQDFSNTDSKVRVFELSNGNKLYAKQSDPYGFWHLNLDKGQLPEQFLGSYSTFDAVVKDVERYQILRGLATVEVKSQSKANRPNG